MKRTTKVTSQSAKPEAERRSRGRTRDDATFPVSSPRAELPDDYGATLADIKQRVLTQRLRVVISANTAMVELYWDIGRTILDRQRNAGWGAKVIDRLSADLRAAYPDMQGFSPRNLKYMRAFAAAWPDATIVQRVAAQLPWRQNMVLLDRLDDLETRLWYAQQVLDHGWSRDILNMQIDNRAVVADRADAACGRRPHDGRNRARVPRTRSDDGAAAQPRKANDPRRRLALRRTGPRRPARAARSSLARAAARTASTPERNYLMLHAARLAERSGAGTGC